jgi:CheY-like chemotaxis protein
MGLSAPDLNHKLRLAVPQRMTQRPSNPVRGAISNWSQDLPSSLPEIDLQKVLVVGKSPINRVVVSRIVERSGLKPTAETPEAAIKTLRLIVPGAVILDGGASNRDCEELMAQLDILRRLTRGSVPCVILLSTSMEAAKTAMTSAVIDAVVAKPITPEQLQPVVERLLDDIRDRKKG